MSFRPVEDHSVGVYFCPQQCTYFLNALQQVSMFNRLQAFGDVLFGKRVLLFKIDMPFDNRKIETTRLHSADAFIVVMNAGNLNAPTIMIAERAADIILGKELLPQAAVPIFAPDSWESKQRVGAPKRQVA